MSDWKNEARYYRCESCGVVSPVCELDIVEDVLVCDLGHHDDVADCPNCGAMNAFGHREWIPQEIRLAE